MPPRADWAALSRRLRRRSARERGWGLSRCVRSIRRTRTCGWACKLAELARRCPILETDAADSLAAESLALAGWRMWHNCTVRRTPRGAVRGEWGAASDSDIETFWQLARAIAPIASGNSISSRTLSRWRR